MKKKLIAAACALSLVASLSISALAAQTYTDVPGKAWYASAVSYVSEKGYMAGTGQDVFSPRGKVTRGTVVTVLWRMEDSPVTGDMPTFSDVSAESWCAQAVAWAQANNIASGDNKGRFQPDASVTREQLAVFLYNYANYKNHTIASGVLSLYSDQRSVSKWAVKAMEHAVGAGLLKGSGVQLLPKGSASRSELAVILQRVETPAMG